MEARVQQFQTDSAAAAAASSPPAKVAKEIATLRRFLHRNQTHRFSDKEQTYLFQVMTDQSYEEFRNRNKKEQTYI